MDYGQNFFTGSIEPDGDILLASAGRDPKKVGIDTKREQELLQAIKERDETLDNWREILIENGLLAIPKTPEEIARETAEQQLLITKQQAEEQARLITSQNEAMAKMMNVLESMEKKLGGYENVNGNGYVAESSIEQVGQDRQENRQIATRTKPSNIKSKANTVSKPK